ncbi:MAG: response regulator, partial [Acidobacteriota bacterium]|nr:response regulator [Acidobacteriota bacterium]
MGLGDHSQNPASDRVLVVDSDAAARAATVRLLERRGYDVVPAGTPGEIESALDENRPRVVVIEPALDGVDGFDLCRDILAAYAGDRPVMVLASHRLHGRAAQLRAKEAGAYLYVERPQQDKVLIDAVALAFADLVPEHGATLPSEIAPEAGGLEVEVAGGRAEVPTSDTPAVSDPEREERDLLDVATRMSSARFDEPPPQQASEVDLLEADPMELENWIDDAFSDFDDRSAPDSAPAAA